MNRLREVFVVFPPSVAIVERLTAAGAEVCEHDRAPCILRCGVRRDVGQSGAPWVTIPQAERLAWLDRVAPLGYEPPIAPLDGYEPPTVTPVGNLLDLLSKVGGLS